MFFDNEQLMEPPTSRAAYSDRTAWLMAEMARLAYYKFEGSVDLADLAQSLTDESNVKSIKTALVALLDEKRESSEEATVNMAQYLEEGNFKQVDTFNVGDTQAFLAKSDVFKMLVLAFRGTEKDIGDIKTDLKASTVEVSGCKIHSGFYQAFNKVKPLIEEALKREAEHGYALYITGHSLGGALALLATKYLAADSVGACYTFGSPRVASSEFGDSIKTPIYRVVNAADIVPRVPPAYITPIAIGFFELVKIPVVSEYIIKLAEKVAGYRHHGDMRYLTASSKADFSDLRLIQNPSLIDRTIRFIKRFLFNYKAIATDHFLEGYCSKLAAYAEYRNKQK